MLNDVPEPEPFNENDLPTAPGKPFVVNSKRFHEKRKYECRTKKCKAARARMLRKRESKRASRMSKRAEAKRVRRTVEKTRCRGKNCVDKRRSHPKKMLGREMLGKIGLLILKSP